MSKRERLIKWVRRRTNGYKGVDVTNLNTCWKDGLAFCALVNSVDCTVINFDRLSASNPKKNLKLAFDTAENRLGVPALLDPEDILDFEVPDDVIIMTYLIEFTKKYATAPIQGGNAAGEKMEMPTNEEIQMYMKEKEAQRKRKEELLEKKRQKSLKPPTRMPAPPRKPQRKLPPPPKIRMIKGPISGFSENPAETDEINEDNIQHGIKRIGDNLSDDSCTIL